ncbi:helix-turn-helix transcriptional regulator [Candidatus Stoquefichus massiliensis]|uniref:helix-turn-helix transcriptional regulator n=1 Tax=Candidatus Stoquefichus massiliensis TaxID=1470350 RepID=UPI0004823FFF|nr:YafY family protein [Candidatus Stoquefichus massiliensis]
MASGRLFEILYYLIDVKQTTAQQLAERFEVSVRTIYRDLDRLLVAGIPIQTSQGVGGGVSIDSHFVLDKTLLNHQEQEQILSALQGLSSLHINEYQDLLGRMQNIFQKNSQDWIEVDFTSWHQDSEMNDKFHQMKEVILKHQIISFDYINIHGEPSHRTVFPLKIFFKGNAWYLQAYEKSRSVYRTYKLTRMHHIDIKENFFDINILEEQPPIRAYHEETCMIGVVFRFQKYLGSFVYDEFEYKDIEEKEDCYIVRTQVPEHQWLLSFVLSFGSGVEIIEPIELREKLKDEIKKIMKLYI